MEPVEGAVEGIDRASKGPGSRSEGDGGAVEGGAAGESGTARESQLAAGAGSIDRERARLAFPPTHYRVPVLKKN